MRRGAVMWGFIGALVFASTAAFAECIGTENLNAWCKRKARVFKLVSIMKDGLPGSTVTFTITDAGGNVIHTEDAITGGDGVARIRIRPHDPGTYTVEVCGVTTTALCEQ